VTSIIQRAAASQTRINEFMDEKNDILSTDYLIDEIRGDVEVKNVSFVYPDSGIKALDKVSFSIDSGESLAIIGTTGSGKSTIANLLMRMYDVTEGKILIDKKDIKAYDVASLRRQIGYVPQDVFLFSDSIANNIGFGLDTIAEGKVEQAAKDADVYDNIIDFPQGFETKLGERGITLSGGQKQRVSIARAIAKAPSILLLDDCLSAVDTKTENAILNSLKKIMENRTSIIISHRVSSAKLADKIIVLDDGKMVEQGSHEYLLNLKGVYAELYEKQTNSMDAVEE
jgi:ATP-binding cassette subfamily B protein